MGYVLRFNPSIRWIKSNISPKKISEIKVQYLSNTLSQKPKGWRNGSFSGVLNEMGSHLIDLIQHILETHEIGVENAKIESCVSDVDDIVFSKLSTAKKLPSP